MSINNRFRTVADAEADKFDPFSRAVTVISENHRMIHEGMMFNLAGIETGVLDGGTVDVLFNLPEGVLGHLANVEYTMDDAPCTVEFFEGTTVSAAGVAANVVNHNRVATPRTPGAIITVGPTVTDVGTVLHERYIPAGGSPGGQPSGKLVEGEDAEWVMGNGDIYLWRITNNSGGTITIGYHFNGYEIDWTKGVGSDA